MKRMVLIACLLLVPLAPAQSHTPEITARGDFVPGEVLVQFQPGVAASERASLLAPVDARVRSTQTVLNLVRVQVPVGRERAIAARLNADPRVRAAGPNYRVRIALVPDDALYAYQWNMGRINAPAAWEITTGSPDVVIAVVDTGLDATHPEFAGKVTPGYNTIDESTDTADDNGHGTHVAGIALAAGNNGIGVAGVAWRARVMPVKAISASGAGTLDDAIDGIIWAAYNQARVINLSWSVELAPDEPIRSVLQGAVDYAWQQGCLVVAAAGNDYLDGNPVLYPAACSHVVAVAATGTADEHAPYSEVQAYVDVAAPGGVAMYSNEPDDHYILSTQWQIQPGYPITGYTLKSGTSQATPHVAGLAALIWTMNPSLTADQVEATIKAGALDLGDPTKFGAGRIDAWSTLQQTPHYLQVSPTQLTFLADPQGMVPAAHQVVNPVSSSGSWTLGSATSWLTITGPTGQTPSTATVSANPGGLPYSYGIYAAALQANSNMPSKANSPVIIATTLIYTDHLYRFYLPVMQNKYMP